MTITVKLNNDTLLDIIQHNISAALVFFDISSGSPKRCGSVILDNDAYEKMKELLP